MVKNLGECTQFTVLLYKHLKRGSRQLGMVWNVRLHLVILSDSYSSPNESPCMGFYGAGRMGAKTTRELGAPDGKKPREQGA